MGASVKSCIQKISRVEKTKWFKEGSVQWVECCAVKIWVDRNLGNATLAMGVNQLIPA